jgi:predicted O-methyltransferase YrrM
MSAPRSSPSEGPVDNRYAASPGWRAVDDYFGALVHEDAVLVAARESGARTTMPNAEVAANQGAFLALLAHTAGARRVLEFGTLAGYSTIWLARAVGEGARVVTLELDERNATVARENLANAGVSDRVDVVVGPAADSAMALIDAGEEPFDVVFIDADKPSNPRYLELALMLTQAGALIVIDNVVRDGEVVNPESDDPRVIGVRQVVTAIAADPRLDATAIQTVGLKPRSTDEPLAGGFDVIVAA